MPSVPPSPDPPASVDSELCRRVLEAIPPHVGARFLALYAAAGACVVHDGCAPEPLTIPEDLARNVAEVADGLDARVLVVDREAQRGWVAPFGDGLRFVAVSNRHHQRTP
jgi:hypothetical protein